MHVEVLQNLGLSPNEAKIYEALLTYGGSSVSTISLRAKVHRRNAYDSIHRLIEKGLVSEVFSEGETVYEAVEPAKLMELIKEKERKLDAILPQLQTSFRDTKAPQRAYIYKGVEGMKNYLREALRAGKDMYEFGAKGGWFDPRMKDFTEWFLDEAKKKKIKFHHIFDFEVKDQLPHVPKAVGKPYKFAPPVYSSKSAIEVYGDRVVTFTGLGIGTLDDDLTIFVIVSPELADSYRTWWQFMWDSIPEEKN
ncbi:TrmB family transcriptional regulator [Candidatus Peribacteria bacterium]|jgi:sugar-specific transcriptional regulator TrmB|nr:TrmB family transcriptional regulator [Candidatus Peribacteria bacterium]MBT4020952.1 TrmB family transcriptional regulator [Candidatus Peribacteria bacterium]MBT4240302.1 TrmB family transcriptional regulator [Candidatus Peribacteria bacterium]MBT4474100.1 TrmB family transcriptional regulator [Candidatus Peribacteria bacterium]